MQLEDWTETKRDVRKMRKQELNEEEYIVLEELAEIVNDIISLTRKWMAEVTKSQVLISVEGKKRRNEVPRVGISDV